MFGHSNYKQISSSQGWNKELSNNVRCLKLQGTHKLAFPKKEGIKIPNTKTVSL